MKELNKLTQRLLNEGYTKDNPPDYVREWNDFYGGWEYTYRYQSVLVFKTPCGLLVKGSHWSSGTMYFGGIEWTLENGNPVIRCPHNKAGCEKNHPVLRDVVSFGNLVQCCCSETAEEYEYSKSVDKAFDDIEAYREKLFEEFKAQKKGRVCKPSCHFDESENRWIQHYNPIDICSKALCRYCPVLGKDLSSKKGNVFYDVKTVVADTEEGLFNQGDIVTVTKGKRLLDKNVSIDICEIIARQFIKQISHKYRMRHHREVFFSEHYGIKYDFEILNVRAETRESRDLEQDLEDIRNGIKVIHHSDSERMKKADSKVKRQKALNAKIKKCRKMLKETGFDHLDTSNQIRIRKMVEKGYISEEEINREPIRKPEQLSLF